MGRPSNNTMAAASGRAVDLWGPGARDSQGAKTSAEMKARRMHFIFSLSVLPAAHRHLDIDRLDATFECAHGFLEHEVCSDCLNERAGAAA